MPKSDINVFECKLIFNKEQYNLMSDGYVSKYWEIYLHDEHLTVYNAQNRKATYSIPFTDKRYNDNGKFVLQINKIYVPKLEYAIKEEAIQDFINLLPLFGCGRKSRKF